MTRVTMGRVAWLLTVAAMIFFSIAQFVLWPRPEDPIVITVTVVSVLVIATAGVLTRILESRKKNNATLSLPPRADGQPDSAGEGDPRE